MVPDDPRRNRRRRPRTCRRATPMSSPPVASAPPMTTSPPTPWPRRWDANDQPPRRCDGASAGAFTTARACPSTMLASAWHASRTGQTLIDNPVSTAPGFTIGNVHVMAGVPKIFRSNGRLASCRTLTGGPPLLSQILARRTGARARSPDRLRRPGGLSFPELSMGSYPFIQNGAHGTNLVIRGTDRGPASIRRWSS